MTPNTFTLDGENVYFYAPPNVIVAGPADYVITVPVVGDKVLIKNAVFGEQYDPTYETTMTNLIVMGLCVDTSDVAYQVSVANNFDFGEWLYDAMASAEGAEFTITAITYDPQIYAYSVTVDSPVAPLTDKAVGLDGVRYIRDKINAKQDALIAGSNITISGGTISATDTTYSDFTGATTLQAGTAGLVPAPTTSDPDKFLKGDGTWGTPTDTTYTAGNGINITNGGISVDTSVVATKTDLGSYVTLGTNQNITGEKTFVGNKRIKFKGTASNSKCGFTSFDQNNGETGFLEVEGTSTGSKKVRLGCYDQASGNARDNYVGFQYHNTKPVGGGTVSYNLVCPPQYKGISGTNAFAYIPVDFTDGNTTVRSGTNGIVDLSTLLPSYSNFTGATSSVAGTNGLVPAPAAGDNTSFLRGDGTWATAVDDSLDYSTSEVDTGHTWIDGSKIYKKTINYGTLPNATTAFVNHGISSLDNVIKIEGVMTEGTVWRTLPYADGAFSSVYATATQVGIYTTVDMTAWSAYVTLYYTKSS